MKIGVAPIGGSADSAWEFNWDGIPLGSCGGNTKRPFTDYLKTLKKWLIFRGRVCFISKQNTQIVTTAIQNTIHIYVVLVHAVKNQIVS